MIKKIKNYFSKNNLAYKYPKYLYWLSPFVMCADEDYCRSRGKECRGGCQLNSSFDDDEY